MTLLKTLGYIMFAAPFVGMFIFLGLSQGWNFAIKVYFIILLGTGWIQLAIYLVTF